MSETAYKLNLGYNGPAHEVEAALALTAGDLPAALRLVSTTLEAAARRCLETAGRIEAMKMRHESGLDVVSPQVVHDPAFVLDPLYVTIAELESVVATGLKAAEAIVTSVEPLVCVAPIPGVVLADAYAKLEMLNRRVGFVLMHPADYTDLRKFGRDVLDVETQARLLKTGLVGKLWGANILINNQFPKGNVILLDHDVVHGTVPTDGAVVVNVIR